MLVFYLALLCLVLLQVPKCFALLQIFWASPKIYVHIVLVTNILCQTKKWFAFSKIVFCACTKVFEKVLNAVKFLGWLKRIGPAQNILGPLKGQVIRVSDRNYENETVCFLEELKAKINCFWDFLSFTILSGIKRAARLTTVHCS